MDEEQIEEVIEICQSYEHGFSAGRMNLAADYNKHEYQSKLYYAWMCGHNTGIQLELIEYEEGYIN